MAIRNAENAEKICGATNVGTHFGYITHKKITLQVTNGHSAQKEYYVMNAGVLRTTTANYAEHLYAQGMPRNRKRLRGANAFFREQIVNENGETKY